MSVSKVSWRSAEPAALLDLAAYLRLIGLDRFAPLPGVPDCELCGVAEAVAVRDTVRVSKTVTARFATRCCGHCGLLFQSPRFELAFYAAYYAQTYRHLVGWGAAPDPAYVADQIARGAALRRYLAPWLPRAGRLLDIGCGAGGMMVDFRDHGWAVRGIEPDRAAAAHAATALRLDVTACDAEVAVLPPAAFDLIVIAGSLEHVAAPTPVLARCHDATAPGGLLLLEAHGLGQAACLGAIGHNHRRLFTATTLRLLMLRHGWDPLWVTDRPICGPTRPGSVFALGRKAAVAAPGVLDATIARGLRDTLQETRARLDRLGIG